MSDLRAIRARAEEARRVLQRTGVPVGPAALVRASAQDVPALLDLVDELEADRTHYCGYAEALNADLATASAELDGGRCTLVRDVAEAEALGWQRAVEALRAEADRYKAEGDLNGWGMCLLASDRLVALIAARTQTIGKEIE